MIEPGATSAIEGNIDHLTGLKLQLWCWDAEAPDRAVMVDLLVNNRLFGRFVADEYRPDLEAAGKGSGRHGLTVDLTGSHLLVPDTAAVLTACAAETPGVPFSSYEITPSFNDAFELTPGIAEHLRKHVPRLVNDAYYQSRIGWGPPTLISLDTSAAAPLVRAAVVGRSGSSRTPISKYVNYTRQRMREEDRFKLGQASIEADNLLKWYLEFYSANRSLNRVPLSVDEIGYLNELIIYGGQRFHLSRVTWMFLLNEPSLLARLDLNSPDSYIEIVYWWAIERSRTLWVEDCLVHGLYSQALIEIGERWRLLKFPLSRFMELYFNRHVEWHFLDMEDEKDRLIYYALLAVGTLRQPTLLQYIPRLWLSKLLQTNHDGCSTLDLFLNQVMEDSPARSYMSDYRTAVACTGFDVDRRKSFTITKDGHRVANVGLRSEIASTGPVSIQLIGPLHKASGLGQATRLSYDALLRHFSDCSAYDFDLDNPAPVGFNSARPSSPLRHAKINLIHLNAESIPLVYAYLPDVFTDAYNIGFFFWELNTPAACHSLALELLDEVWVCSRYGVEQYAPFAKIPVTNVSMSFEDLTIPRRETARQYLQGRLGYDSGCFVFFAAFDSFSFVQRKNPQGVVRAFLDAFPTEPNVRLILKTHNRDFVHDPVQAKIWQMLDEAVIADPRITIINETLVYDQLLLLKASCDCYVSLHRSEGWGFGMIEAMHLGIAVLATNYSGNTEFCSSETAWVVDYQLSPMAANDYIFVSPGQIWAEPDHADAVRQMQGVFGNADERNRRVVNAKAFVDERFSPSAVAERYAARLAEISELDVTRERHARRRPV